MEKSAGESVCEEVMGGVRSTRLLNKRIPQYFRMQGASTTGMKLLSEGNHSQIYEFGGSGGKVVLKVVPSKAKKQVSHLKNEFRVLQLLHHPNIVVAHRCREDVTFPRNQQDKQSCSTHSILVLEHAAKGSLLSYLQREKPSQSLRRSALRQVARALHYLHSEGLAHRDLKLQNILVFDQEPEPIFKIADFGFASRFQSCPMSTPMLFADYKGTKKGYMAPEIHNIRKDSSQPYHADKADIFAFGVIFFALVLGHFPFEYALETDKFYRLIKEDKFDAFWLEHKVQRFEDDPDLRFGEFRQIFEGMVRSDPSVRPSAAEVLACPFLSKETFQS